MTIVLTIIGVILVLLGFFSNFFPILPGGVLFSYAALVLLYISDKAEYGLIFLVVFGIITLITMLLDNLIPATTAKSKGATKNGLLGAGIGTFIGMFVFPPFGIIIGILVGSIIGEIISRQEFKKALEVGVWSFIGFLISTLLKIIITGVMTFYYFLNLIK